MSSSVNKLVVAISSRALFNLSESHEIFQSEGIVAYSDYQIENENVTLAPGVAFPLVDKLGKINALVEKQCEIQIILISRNSADTGLRVFNSIEHYGLDVKTAAFTGGQNPYNYINALGANLFLSAEAGDVVEALRSGVAAAFMLPTDNTADDIVNPVLKIAFDGDAVIFSDQAEKIFQQQGLQSFEAHERNQAGNPLPGGPFKSFLSVIHDIQQIPEARDLIRTALITARGAPAHERVIRTLRAWNIRIDEAFFMGGRDKGAILKAYGADIFFDDQQTNCESTRLHVPTGYVKHQ